MLRLRYNTGEPGKEKHRAMDATLKGFGCYTYWYGEPMKDFK